MGICIDQLLISIDLVVKTIKALILIRIYSDEPIDLTKHEIGIRGSF